MAHKYPQQTYASKRPSSRARNRTRQEWSSTQPNWLMRATTGATPPTATLARAEGRPALLWHESLPGNRPTLGAPWLRGHELLDPRIGL